MAKYIKTYELHLGDRVQFKASKDTPLQLGTIQDLSSFPDVWVEVGDPRAEWPIYNRYKISVNLIESCIDNYNWYESDLQFEKNEALEFIYDNDYKRIITNSYKED